MIQFNLLPDIKIQYIKARRTKRMVLSIASSVAGVSLVIFALLFVAVGFQKQHIKNLSSDISKNNAKLQSIQDLDKILTVQNQLNKLTELHEAKPVVSRLKQYITQTTPTQVSYASISVDFAENTIVYSGSADSIKTVNQFVDTLKFTKYKTGGDSTEHNAFTSVVLETFGKDIKGSSYGIKLSFDPAIFSSSSQVELIVPQITTTRSATDRPSDALVQPLSKPTETGGN